MTVGVGWYTREEWEKLTTVVPDRSELDDTYEAWKNNAEKAEANLATQGISVARIPVSVDALVHWCKSRRLPVNGAARAEYVSELVGAQNV